MKRDEGYYWCRYDDGWVIAWWQYPYWHVSGEMYTNDAVWNEIDERRIVRDETTA